MFWHWSALLYRRHWSYITQSLHRNPKGYAERNNSRTFWTQKTKLFAAIRLISPSIIRWVENFQRGRTEMELFQLQSVSSEVYKHPNVCDNEIHHSYIKAGSVSALARFYRVTYSDRGKMVVILQATFSFQFPGCKTNCCILIRISMIFS